MDRKLEVAVDLLGLLLEETSRARGAVLCHRRTTVAMAWSYETKEVISVGYNGPAALSCSGERGSCGCAHAEVRMLADGLVAIANHPCQGLLLLSTLAPCINCANLLLALRKFRTVLYLHEWRAEDPRSKMLLRAGGIDVRKFSV